MLVSGENLTVAVIIVILAASLLIDTCSAEAVLFTTAGNSQVSASLHRVDYVAPISFPHWAQGRA